MGYPIGAKVLDMGWAEKPVQRTMAFTMGGAPFVVGVPRSPTHGSTAHLVVEALALTVFDAVIRT